MSGRRRKDKGANPIVLLVMSVLGFLILALTVIGIVALYGAWIYYEKRARRMPTSLSDVKASHTIKEKVHLRALNIEAAKLSTRLEELQVQGKKVNRRKDGAFDERSQLGKQLNADIPEVEEKLDEVTAQLDEIEDAPRARIREWISVKSSLYALRYTSLSYPLICIFALYTKQEGVKKISHIVENNVGSPLFGIENLYGALTASLLVSGILFALAKILINARLRHSTETVLNN